MKLTEKQTKQIEFRFLSFGTEKFIVSIRGYPNGDLSRPLHIKPCRELTALQHFYGLATHSRPLLFLFIKPQDARHH